MDRCHSIQPGQGCARLRVAIKPPIEAILVFKLSMAHILYSIYFRVFYSYSCTPAPEPFYAVSLLVLYHHPRSALQLIVSFKRSQFHEFNNLLDISSVTARTLLLFRLILSAVSRGIPLSTDRKKSGGLEDHVKFAPSSLEVDERSSGWVGHALRLECHRVVLLNLLSPIVYIPVCHSSSTLKKPPVWDKTE